MCWGGEEVLTGDCGGCGGGGVRRRRRLELGAGGEGDGVGCVCGWGFGGEEGALGDEVVRGVGGGGGGHVWFAKV